MPATICKTPINIQSEVADCGVACLSIVLDYYQAYIDYNELKAFCDPGTIGLTFEALISAAEHYNLQAKKKIYTVDTLQGINMPLIIVLDHQHFMVFEGIKGKKVYLNDPMQGRIIYSVDEFTQHFSCVGLELVPKPNFKKNPRPHPVWQAFKALTQNSMASYIYLGILFLFSTVPAIVSANYTNIFIDTYLLEHQKHIMVPFFCLMLLFIVLQITIESCQHFMTKKLQMLINTSVNSDYLSHLFKLPYAFFSRRPTGDLINILHSNTELAFQLSSRVFLSVLSILHILIYLLVMLSYSVVLTLIVLAAITLSFSISYFFKEPLMLLHTKMRSQQGLYYAISMYLIQLLPAIKISGKNNYFLMRWLNAFIDVQNSKQYLSFYHTLIGHCSSFLVAITAALITTIGCIFIIEGKLTVGQLMAFSLLSGLLHQPIKSITNLYSLLISTNVNLKRNEAVTEQSIRPALLQTDLIEESSFSDSQQRSQGDLSIEKLRFRYNKHSPDIIKEISFEINGLQKIAIIGQSGCGKSTLLHCLAGIFTSYQGTLLLNQLPLANYSESQLRRLLLLVSKQTRLISGTIYQNICLGDNFSNQEIIEVLNLVGLAEAVNQLPLGIHQPIAAEQSNLSQGQLKQLDLAAAIIRKPNILLLDEPFDTLDNALEDRVVDNLMSLSLTAIVITHRLRHLPLFDKVLWLEAGTIKAFDTHNKLMQQNPDYYNFINRGVM